MKRSTLIFSLLATGFAFYLGGIIVDASFSTDLISKGMRGFGFGIVFGTGISFWRDTRTIEDDLAAFEAMYEHNPTRNMYVDAWDDESINTIKVAEIDRPMRNVR